MKERFNKYKIKRDTKRVLLMLAVSTFPTLVLLLVGFFVLNYKDGTILCSKKEMINDLNSLYFVKTELVKEREKTVAQAMYFDTLAGIDTENILGLKTYIADKTTRDLKIGDINTSISEIDDYAIDVKKCDYDGDKIDRRMKSILENVFGNDLDQTKLQ